MATTLKLGTRKSMLAWAQSNWVAREIEKHNPGTKVELVGIETRGDIVQDISLQKLSETTGGKDFFVAEIDSALKLGAVDLTVHSMKDLSLERPPEFVLAANPKRENPRDVALFSPDILERLKSGKEIRIGTSSPRRLENIPGFLKRALPFQAQSGSKIKFVEIRGNVNTRLSRVHESEDSSKKVDGVILAFAGLIRLFQDEKGREELSRLLKDVKWMVLPLRENPTAPAQGALAIECRKADAQIVAQISKIHDRETAEHVALERDLLSKWGGGCHQRFGATAISVPALSKIFFIRGVKQDGSFVEDFQWHIPNKPWKETDKRRGFDGSLWRADVSEQHPWRSPPIEKDQPVFIAHSRALPEGQILEGARFWTSGTPSWFRLAERGIWIEGCAEGLGFDTLKPTLEEKVLQLAPLKKWFVLTHDEAAENWSETVSSERVVATYAVQSKYPPEARRQLSEATDVFWSSGSQFLKLKQALSPNQLRSVRHACGPGKSATELTEELSRIGVKPVIFPSVEEWRRWIKA